MDRQAAIEKRINHYLDAALEHLTGLSDDEVVVTVAVDYSGILTNVLQATATYTLTTVAYRPVEAELSSRPGQASRR
jgi:hypothetical protein